MKLLFDQNLSRKLTNRLTDIFPESSHGQFHGLAEKTDTEIWEFQKSPKLPSRVVEIEKFTVNWEMPSINPAYV